MDIQQKLDEWLAANPDAQQYVSQLYYVPEMARLPEDATHVVRLASAPAPERQVTIAAVVVPKYAVVVDLLLAMVATTPPPS
jgi:hypothetical protein